MSRLDDVKALLETEGITGEARQDPPDDQHPDDLPPGEMPDDADAAPPADPDAPPEIPKIKLQDAAEKLGVDLYNGLQVPMGNGTHLSLGEVKDLAVRGKKALAEISEIRETADNSHRELMLQRADLMRATELLAPALTPEQQARVEALKTTHNNREISLLLDAMPHWRQAESAQKELGRIQEYAGKYGISAPELEALVQDHRLIKLLRDVAVAVPKSKAPPKPAGRNTNQTQTDAYKRATAPGASKADKIQGIASLLN
jgi:hypothetical protein